MGSHIGSHTDGDSRRTVQKEQRSLGREHGRFLKRIVKVVGHIHGILVQIGKHLIGKFRELCLGISHGRYRVAVHRAEVTLTEHQRVSHAPELGHPDHRVINARVTVGMVFSQHLSYNPRRLLCLSGIAETESFHSEKHSPVDRL